MRYLCHHSFLSMVLVFSALPILECAGNDGSNPNISDFRPQIQPTEDYKYAKASGTTRLIYNSFYCKSNTSSKIFSKEHTRDFGEVIKALHPDVIAIQELDSACNERSQRYLLQEIQQAAGDDYNIVFGSAAPFDGGKIGCGVMYKKTLQPTAIRQVALPGHEKRKLILISFPQFNFIGTHLDLETRHRQSSIDLLQHELPTLPNAPVFFAGDLNDSPMWKAEVSAFPKLLQNFTILSATTGSLPDEPNETIDYVLVDKAHQNKVEVKQTHVVKQLYMNGSVKETKAVSDHYPVFVDVKLK
ncbi:endonuclease/exonuclease/phosphatase family protein [Segatella oulorum]|uniref:endonuclease/exonuclease/phosphatase family protein n=1 Tax=Segatella oulorum TaxID=28136 RepID=UPI0028E86659|nr:endonuclease/exonuclease/phosphatase family protein [Segatella oulorum]